MSELEPSGNRDFTMPSPVSLLRAIGVLCASLIANVLPAQCTFQALGVPGVQGVGPRGHVTALTTWDPDGAGPVAPQLVVAGTYVFAGDLIANNIALRDTATGVWSTLGSGLDGIAYAVAVLPSGELVVGGSFGFAGGTPASCIAKWNGTSWSSLGSGMDGAVRALVVMPNGELVAGGDFTVAGGIAASRVARWNGNGWAPLGAGADGSVQAFALQSNGDLIAVGAFLTADGVPVRQVARWNGTAWSAIGAPPWNVNVFWLTSVAVLPNGRLMVGGYSLSALSQAFLWQWDGTVWSSVAQITGGPSSLVLALGLAPNGDLLVSGLFQRVGTTNALGIARWNGTTWSAMGAGLGDLVSSMTHLPNGDLVAGGRFTSNGLEFVGRLARFNGSVWQPLDDSTNGSVTQVAPLASGDVVVGGTFTLRGGVSANRLARWSSSGWSPLGAGSATVPTAVVAHPDGSVLAAGTFTLASGSAYTGLARWDGIAWNPLGALTPPSSVAAVVVMPDGAIVAAGSFSSIDGVAAASVARWDGSNWSPLGAGINGTVGSLAVMQNGDLIAGGNFTTSGSLSVSRIARWDGATWSALSTGMNNQVLALAVLPDGGLVAAGLFTSAGGVAARSVARWDGTSWSALGSGVSMALVFALVVLPNGDVVAAGGASSPPGTRHAERWDGSTWSPVGSWYAGYIVSMKLGPDGTIFAVGSFLSVGELHAPYFARLAPTCPSRVDLGGSACSGSGGSNRFEATSLPWLGSEFTTRATGLATNALVAVVTGFAPAATPLGSLVPQAPAACSLWESADLVEPMFSFTGSVEPRLLVPESAVLIGLAFHQQLVVLEFDANASLVQSTSTNSLVATVGAL